jgi:ketosteroid isomerase-like protein
MSLRDTSRAMSQENAEVVKLLYDALNRRDWESFGKLVQPDVELPGTIGGLEEGRFIRGVDGIKQVTEEEDTEVWEKHLIEPEIVIDAGEQVVVVQREYQRGKGSGIDIVAETAVVFDVRDGLVARIQAYMDRAAALEAAGLSEQDARTGT